MIKNWCPRSVMKLVYWKLALKNRNFNCSFLSRKWCIFMSKKAFPQYLKGMIRQFFQGAPLSDPHRSFFFIAIVLNASYDRTLFLTSFVLISAGRIYNTYWYTIYHEHNKASDITQIVTFLKSNVYNFGIWYRISHVTNYITCHYFEQ